MLKLKSICGFSEAIEEATSEKKKMENNLWPLLSKGIIVKRLSALNWILGLIDLHIISVCRNSLDRANEQLKITRKSLLRGY